MTAPNLPYAVELSPASAVPSVAGLVADAFADLGVRLEYDPDVCRLAFGAPEVGLLLGREGVLGIDRRIRRSIRRLMETLRASGDASLRIRLLRNLDRHIEADVTT